MTYKQFDMEKLRQYFEEERGRMSRLAEAIGVTPEAVSQWAASRVPAERVHQVESVTGIPARELRPDMFEGVKPSEAAA
jgi:DNA-binding transcriptional regulator YdaS (Cro superfamily)